MEWGSSSLFQERECVWAKAGEQDDGVMSLGRWGSGKTQFGFFSKFSESV